MKSVPPFYESKAALEQYLFFHYGTAKEYLAYPGPEDALHYPARAFELLVDLEKLPRDARGLDLGCAVGRTSFEMTRHCREVIGIDLSRSFIRAANRMKKAGKMTIRYAVEGERNTQTVLHIPTSCRPQRATFRIGDAMNISTSLGTFDVAVLLNLIDRVPDPALCLKRLYNRLNPGAQLILASPYTWLPEYTPRAKWLGGRTGVTTFSALRRLLQQDYTLQKQIQIPFLIREHARKYQWSVAEGPSWIRKD